MDYINGSKGHKMKVTEGKFHWVKSRESQMKAPDSFLSRVSQDPSSVREPKGHI